MAICRGDQCKYSIVNKRSVVQTQLEAQAETLSEATRLRGLLTEREHDIHQLQEQLQHAEASQATLKVCIPLQTGLKSLPLVLRVLSL